MPKRITELMIERLSTPKSGRRFIWDSVTSGLGLKISHKGPKVFVLQKVYPGHTTQTKRTLGTYSEAFKLEAARAKAKRWVAWIGQGIDPAMAEEEERRKLHAERQATIANSFKIVAEAYIAERQSWDERNRRIKYDAREIRRDLIGVLGDKPISEITPADVRSLITSLKKRSAHTARGAWNHASGIFKWAVHEDYLRRSLP